MKPIDEHGPECPGALILVGGEHIHSTKATIHSGD